MAETRKKKQNSPKAPWMQYWKCQVGPAHYLEGSADTFDLFKDDFAWTIWVVELTVWTYIFCIVVFLTTFFTWCIILWALVMLAVIAAAFAAV